MFYLSKYTCNKREIIKNRYPDKMSKDLNTFKTSLRFIGSYLT